MKVVALIILSLVVSTLALENPEYEDGMRFDMCTVMMVMVMARCDMHANDLNIRISVALIIGVLTLTDENFDQVCI